MQFNNPKAMLLTPRFSGFAFSGKPEENIIKFVINAIWIPSTSCGWPPLSARRMDLPRRVQITINVVMAVPMLLVVKIRVLHRVTISWRRRLSSSIPSIAPGSGEWQLPQLRDSGKCRPLPW